MSWKDHGVRCLLPLVMACMPLHVFAQPVPNHSLTLSGLAAAPLMEVDLGREAPSVQAQELTRWIVRSTDHQGLPFVVVDKIHARVFVFNKEGRLLGAAPALLGLTRGDEGMEGMGDRPLSQILPELRITPAGRFTAELDRNVLGQAILLVDYEQAISLHPVRSLNLKEHRLERLATASVKDNRITYGCINVPVLFWEKVVMPTFLGTRGIVYVMPDSRTLTSVFVHFGIRSGAAVAE